MLVSSPPEPCAGRMLLLEFALRVFLMLINALSGVLCFPFLMESDKKCPVPVSLQPALCALVLRGTCASEGAPLWHPCPSAGRSETPSCIQGLICFRPKRAGISIGPIFLPCLPGWPLPSWRMWSVNLDSPPCSALSPVPNQSCFSTCCLNSG